VSPAGYLVVALLAATAPTRGLTEEDRCVAAALFAVLGTAIEFVVRRRDYARRLQQVRNAKVAWEGTVDALPHIVCFDQEGTVTRVNRAVEVWGLGSVKSATCRTLHELLHPGCANPGCGKHQSLALTTTHECLRAATSRLADTQLALGETRRQHRLVLENTWPAAPPRSQIRPLSSA
jgi:hypothetical protein